MKLLCIVTLGIKEYDEYTKKMKVKYEKYD